MKSEFLSKEKKIVKKTFWYKMLVQENFGPKENLYNKYFLPYLYNSKLDFDSVKSKVSLWFTQLIRFN